MATLSEFMAWADRGAEDAPRMELPILLQPDRRAKAPYAARRPLF